MWYALCGMFYAVCNFSSSANNDFIVSKKLKSYEWSPWPEKKLLTQIKKKCKLTNAEKVVVS